ncbi:MAG: glycosyltransferase family 2 protein [Dehalococcoidia bacterium]|nr:glycosyltransferase family 2 protein [Dehalococcoidia bacterium]
MNQPKVSTITLNYNGLEDTTECLESLKKINYPNYEVIVVDNGSDGNDAQLLEEKFGDYIHLIKNDKNYGFAGAVNIAIKYALDNSSPDYLLLLDNDTVVDKNFLDELVQVITRDSKVGAVTAVIYSYNKPDQIQQSLSGRINFWIGDLIGMDWFSDFFLVPTNKDNLPREVKQPGFWCALFKRECIENVGLMDRTYFFTWETADYCMRLGRAGYKIVYAPKAKIWHKWRTSGKIDGRSQYYLLKNRFKFMRKYATRMQNIAFLTFFFAVHFWLATAYYLIWLRRPRMLLSFYKGVRDGLFLFHSGR